MDVIYIYVLLAIVLVLGVAEYIRRPRSHRQDRALKESERPLDSHLPKSASGVKNFGWRLVARDELDSHVASLLPTKGSEDATGCLTFSKVPATRPESRERRPDERIEWVIDLDWDEPRPIRRNHLNVLRDTIIGEELPHDVHWHGEGGSARTGSDFRGDGSQGEGRLPSRVSFSLELLRRDDDRPGPRTAAELSRFLEAVEKIGNELGASSVVPRTPIREAEKRSLALMETWEESHWIVTIQLLAPEASPFEGKDLWDVMMSLGLRFGDMDLFHWQSLLRDFGADELFSVWTSSGEGFFVLEDIAAGRFRAKDLLFGYSVPKSADPLQVFDSLRRALEYAQKRLGGEFRDPDHGRPVDFNAEREAIETAVARFETGGFVPGEPSACRIF
jgi:cell division protein ZipA